MTLTVVAISVFRDIQPTCTIPNRPLKSARARHEVYQADSDRHGEGPTLWSAATSRRFGLSRLDARSLKRTLPRRRFDQSQPDKALRGQRSRLCIKLRLISLIFIYSCDLVDESVIFPRGDPRNHTN